MELLFLGFFKFSLGVAGGYLVSSYIESFLHENVSDARPRQVRFWKKYPKILKPLINTHYSHHTIHHARTWRQDHVTQFRSDDEREKLNNELHARGRHGRLIMKGDYATKLHNEGALVFTAPLILACLLLFNFTPFLFALGACTTVFLPTLFSYFVHPYLHMPHAKGQVHASKPMAWLLRTRYFKAMYVNHFIHHRYGGTSNFNLVLGADVLRRRNRAPVDTDMEIMRNIGIPCD